MWHHGRVTYPYSRRETASFTAVKEEVGERAEVWAGTGSNFTRATIELTQAASRTGVDGIMLVTPYYNKPSQDGLYEHFRKIAEAADLPVMLHNVPGRTGANLLPETAETGARSKT